MVFKFHIVSTDWNDVWSSSRGHRESIYMLIVPVETLRLIVLTRVMMHGIDLRNIWFSRVAVNTNIRNFVNGENGIDRRIQLRTCSVATLLRNDGLSGSLILTLQFYRIVLHARLGSHMATWHDVAWHCRGSVIAEDANLVDDRALLEKLLRNWIVGIFSLHEIAVGRWFACKVCTCADEFWLIFRNALIVRAYNVEEVLALYTEILEGLKVLSM